jgi:serine/threonine-protein kinase RsbW
VDQITLRIPASPAFVQVVRLTAASLASRLGFSIDDIEDLKIGVDELSAYMTGAQGREGTLEINFRIDDDRIEIQGVGRFMPGVKVRTELTDFSKQILDTVVDNASLSQTDGTATFNLSKGRRV